ncbi:hypothetical protein G6F57_004815 [Rhizopus arrhizus]|uniref:Uncharacterized protein n=1 Tax=Rhizopus oryzae TaxID=64495 RepID=A0A9P6X8N4_RHIOR|nr:hypothetical protein G6F23_003208 [Rhizopus arrhizus]KAG0764774.1 hypothetical protein G6F24_004954 [Rhizopus arrhizus]KAG0776503.1 hypothetical protein G6F22_012525 [Rhizopus arrhizus]KAG0794459.1 hypothetical protein G6F21_002844 [Rhizopus arrhizus]KAG0811289.1 hypothetical protein G6F20_007276 [Rhizopus arrhizus]
MNVVTKDSMADDELEEMKNNLINLILEEEDFQLVQISLQEESCLVPKAAKKASIPRSTAYRIWNEFNESGGKELPGFKKKRSKQDNRGRSPILIEEHTQFLIKYIDLNVASTVDLAYDELCQAFPDETGFNLHIMRNIA